MALGIAQTSSSQRGQTPICQQSQRRFEHRPRPRHPRQADQSIGLLPSPWPTKLVRICPRHFAHSNTALSLTQPQGKPTPSPTKPVTICQRPWPRRRSLTTCPTLSGGNGLGKPAHTHFSKCLAFSTATPLKRLAIRLPTPRLSKAHAFRSSAPLALTTRNTHPLSPASPPNEGVSGTACFPRSIVGDVTSPSNRRRCPTA